MKLGEQARGSLNYEYSCGLLHLKLRASRSSLTEDNGGKREDVEERHPKLGRILSRLLKNPNALTVTTNRFKLSSIGHSTCNTLGKQYSSSDRPYGFLRN